MPARRERDTLRPPGGAASGLGASGNRLMYNLGQGSSSGLNLSSSALASSSYPTSSGHPVPATEAPYLTNVESHFGRMTLTAPDNMRRKQAKEKKQKIRQKKAQTAQIAAAALAGVSNNGIENSYDSAGAGPCSLARPSMQRGISSGYSSGGHITPAATSSGRRTPVGQSATPAATARTRRRPASNPRLAVPGAQDDAGGAPRPSSRTSRRTADQPSRPASSLSQNVTSTPAAPTPPSRSRQASGDDGHRSRSDSAPAAGPSAGVARQGASPSTPQRSVASPDAADSTSVMSGEQASISSAMAQQASLRRYNIWNDIAGLPGADEPDPDDLPPPFPEGATRPRTPPQPPPAGREWTEEERLAYEEAERWRVPDSPPPAFRTDPESDGSGREDRTGGPRRNATARRRARASGVGCAGARASSPPPVSSDAVEPTRGSEGRASRPGSPSESSASETEAEEAAEERLAWEADIRAGLSFEERLLREQERREARERALLIARGGMPPDWVHSGQDDEDDEEAEAVVAHSGVLASAGPAVEISEEVAVSQGQVQVEAGDEPHTVDEAGTEDDDFEDAVATHGNAVATSEPGSGMTTFTQHVDADGSSMEVRDAVEGGRSEVLAAAMTSTAGQDNAPAETVHAPREATVASASASAHPTGTPPPSRQTLHNEPRLGNAVAKTSPGHRRTTSDSVGNHAAASGIRQPSVSKHVATRLRSRPASESHSRFRDDASAAAERRSNLWSRAPRRPEDLLYTVSAPPPPATASSDQLVGPSLGAAAQQSTTAVVSTSDEEAGADDGLARDSGMESDDSADQWMAEAAAFEALRRKEEAAAERLRRLRVVPQEGDPDSSSEDEAPLAERHVPGHFDPLRPSMPVSPGLNRLASMEKTVAKAPPPLVLGRSRGGAAYSSSSASSDTDEGRLPSSSGSEEGDEDDVVLIEHHTRPQPTALERSLASNVIEAQLPAPQRRNLTESDRTVPRPRAAQTASSTTKDSVPTQPAQALERTKSVSSQQALASTAARSDTANRSSRSVPDLTSRDSPVASAEGSGLSRKGTVYVPITLRMVEEPPRPQEAPRAGVFQEDSSSSRDVSEAEERPAGSLSSPQSKRRSMPVQPSSAGTVGAARPTLQPKKSVDSYSKMLPTLPSEALTLGEGGVEASDPATSGAKAPLSSRLRGLFGTPLVEPKPRTPSISAAPPTPAASAKGKEPMRSPDTTPIDEEPSLQRRPSVKSVKSDKSTRIVSRGDPHHQEEHEPVTSIAPATSQAQDRLQKRPSTNSIRSVSSRHPSHSDAATKVDAPSQLPSVVPTRRASQKSIERRDEPVEQRARDEALAQIAQLQSTSAARQDSLAALERLLARTARPMSLQPPPRNASPTSMYAPSADPQPRTLIAGVDGGPSSVESSASVSTVEPPSSGIDAHQARWPGANRLSRSGALYRSRDGGPPPPPPVSYNMRPSARPASFVNPRSSVAPLPRGRLPTITDATRHFPPSQQSTGVVRTPSWLVHIPSAERNQLPPPLEPKRLSTSIPGAKHDGREASSMGSAYRNADVPTPAPLRTAGSRVSAMISKFEVPASPQQASGPSVAESIGDEPAIESAARPEMQRYGGASSTAAHKPSATGGELALERVESLSRRPPPPPPLVASASPSATNNVVVPRAAQQGLQAQTPSTDTMPAPASTNPFGPSALPPGAAPSASYLTAPASGPSVPRSPRTQALDMLTQREASGPSAPGLPSKSPLLPPEQLFHPSRRGLNQTLAAAQAASRSRRENRPQSQPSPNLDLEVVSAPQVEQGQEQRPMSMHGRPLPVPQAQSSKPLAGLFGPVQVEDGIAAQQAPLQPPRPAQPSLAGNERRWAGEDTFASSGRYADRPSSGPRPLPTLPASVRQASNSPVASAGSRDLRPRHEPQTEADSAPYNPVRSGGQGSRYSPVAPPRPPPVLSERPRNRDWDALTSSRPLGGGGSPGPSSETTNGMATGWERDPPSMPRQPRSQLEPPASHTEADRARASLDDDREMTIEEEAQQAESTSGPSTADLIHAAVSAVGRSGSIRTIAPSRGGAVVSSPPSSLPSTLQQTGSGEFRDNPRSSDIGAESTSSRAAGVETSSTATGSSSLHRAPSLGYTDLDLLVARLEAMQTARRSSPTTSSPSGVVGSVGREREGEGGVGGEDYDLLTTLSEFLGPAKPTVASHDEISSLPLGPIECERRRVTKEGKVRQKLSLAGVRVDRCGVCLDQFRMGQWAVLCRCTHVLHEGCARRLFRMVRRCPTCRRDCFVEEEEEGVER